MTLLVSGIITGIPPFPKKRIAFFKTKQAILLKQKAWLSRILLVLYTNRQQFPFLVFSDVSCKWGPERKNLFAH
ncbi:hypothetical protein FF2_036542 [Malus domestica]